MEAMTKALSEEKSLNLKGLTTGVGESEPAWVDAHTRSRKACKVQGLRRMLANDAIPIEPRPGDLAAIIFQCASGGSTCRTHLTMSARCVS